jgi:hypothetical protein
MRIRLTMLGAETFKERAEAWLCEVQRRRYGKYKTSTLPTISGALRKHVYPVIGHLPLAQVNNKSCKPFISTSRSIPRWRCMHASKALSRLMRSLTSMETWSRCVR